MDCCVCVYTLLVVGTSCSDYSKLVPSTPPLDERVSPVPIGNNSGKHAEVRVAHLLNPAVAPSEMSPG